MAPSSQALVATLALAVVACTVPVAQQATGGHHMSEAEIKAIPSAFEVTIKPPHDPKFQPIAVALAERDTVNKIGWLPSMLLDLSHVHVPVVVEQCGEANASYSPRAQRIQICYELVALTNKLGGKPIASLDNDTNYVVAFTALHEIAHALIDLMHINVANEEDRADQFAFLVMTNYKDIELGRTVMHAPAAFFANLDDVEDRSDKTDPHSRAIYRAGNAICLLWGRQHDPELGQRLGDRAAQCDAYTTEVLSTWNGWLQPYTRVDSGRTF